MPNLTWSVLTGTAIVSLEADIAIGLSKLICTRRIWRKYSELMLEIRINLNHLWKSKRLENRISKELYNCTLHVCHFG